MNWHEDDFYNEPSEFDIQIDEFKRGLMKSVKDEFISEIERLKAENKELQDIKKNFEQVKRDFDRKKSDLDYEYQTLKNNVRKERLVELLKDHKTILYKASSKRELLPKCDKCDNRRRVKYTSPLGRETSEDCLCSEGRMVYYPREFILYEFRLNRDKNGMTAWYKQYSDNEDGFTYDSSIHVDSIYTPEMKFEELESYGTFFKTKEECQTYCDYLNENVNP